MLVVLLFLIYPNYEHLIKVLRILLIIFVRLFIWIGGLILLQDTEIYFIASIITLLFFSLDIYWLSVTFINFNKKMIKITVKYIKKNNLH